jgi:NAD(P)-dependent dehydrogenase (short-subunit alcohol dehydrogenase family)
MTDEGELPMVSSHPKRVALVTGSASGIGAAIARRLSAEGFSVVVHSRTSVDEGRALAAELDRAVYLQADLSVEAARGKLIADAVRQWGRLDVLINNAGMSCVIPHADLDGATPAIWRELHEINVIAPWQLITEATPMLRQSNSAPCVVNIASHAGVRPKGASIPYAVSKAGLIHMTKLLAVALAPAIRVNAIAPGLVDTPMTVHWEDARRLWSERSPMRRAAIPEDIAEIANMLIKSNYLTGEIILADGGLNLT